MNRREAIVGAIGGVVGFSAVKISVADVSTVENAQAVLKQLADARQAATFTDQAIDRESLDAVFKFGVSALSHRNEQPWFVSIVQDRELLKAIDSDAKLDSSKRLSFGGASAAFIISAAEDDSDYQHFAIGGMVERLIIAATLKGLGVKTVKAGLDKVNESADRKKQLQIPDGFNAYVALLIGYEATPTVDGASGATTRELHTKKFAYIPE